MKYTVCAYFDTELEKFFPPFLAPQPVQDCLEGIQEAAIKGKIEDVEHKKVFYMGEFDTTSGMFELKEKPELLITLASYARKAD